MATYNITGPDGNAYSVTAPDGASQDAVLAYVKANAGKAGANPAIKPAQGRDLGAVWSGLRNTADAATMGLVEPAQAALAVGINRLAGGYKTYDQVRQEMAAEETATDTAHPYAALGGTVAGALSGGAAIGKMLPAALAGGRSISGIKDILRAAGIGGVMGGVSGGVQGYAETGDTGAAATGAVAGAETGAVLGPATEIVAPRLLPAGAKAMKMFAKIIDEPPEVIQQAIDNFRLGTSPTGNPAHGRTPMMAEIMSLKQQGAIRDLARGHPNLASPLAEAAQAQTPVMQDSLGKVIGKPIAGVSAPTAASDALADSYTRLPADGTPEAMDAWVKNEGDKQFKALHGQSVTLAPDEVEQLKTIMNDTPLGRATQREALDRLDTGTLELDHADALRKKLTLAASKDPAGPFYEDKQWLEGLLSGKSPEYAQAVSDYAHRAQLAEGVALGQKVAGSDPTGFSASVTTARPDVRTGVPIGARSAMLSDTFDPKGVASFAEGQAHDTRMQEATRTALGSQAQQNIQRVAATESGARASLRGSAPPSVGVEEDNSPAQAMHALAAVTYSNPGIISYHLSHLMKGESMSPKVAAIVGKYLTDPAMTKQAYNILKRAGAQDADIMRFAAGVAAAGGGTVGRGVVKGQ